MLRLAVRFHYVPVLLLLAIWSGWFIHQGSFEINGERYYSLFDDGMISMTYAKNLTQGHGLNWAKFGDPVEGFSSPLWTFLMVPFQLLPIGWGKVSLAFAMFCAGILGLNVVVLDRILRKRLGITAILPRFAATLTLAFLYPLNYWSLVGMECGPQVLVFLLGIDQFLAFEQEKQTKHLYKLGMVLAAAMLVRMDMVFFVGMVILFLAPWLWKNQRQGLKFLLIAGLPMVAYMLFRMAYFHDIFPNTYYLKLHKISLDLRIERAWFHFKVWAKPLWLIWLLLPVMMVPLIRNKAMWLSLALIAIYLGYNLYAGGDAWEESEVGANRFTIITLPWVILIFAAGGHGWAKWLKGVPATVVANVVPVLTCGLLLVLVNGLLFVGNSSRHWNRLLVRSQPYNTEFQMWNVMKAMDLNRDFGPGNRVAVVQAGDIGYFAECELVDVLGYNDKVIAKLPPYWDLRSTPINEYIPGHAKLDYRHTIVDLAPDCILDVWLRHSPAVVHQLDSLLLAHGYQKRRAGGWISQDFQRSGQGEE